jgi:hypothetical protein
MNHRKVHDQLIDRAKSRLKESGTYYEKHHIIPKCMGGLDSEDNLVNLTAREHFLVHWLLVEIYRGTEYHYKLLSAWSKMCCYSKRQIERSVSSRYFKYAREEYHKSRLKTEFDVDVVIYDEVTRSIRYEGKLRDAGFRPHNLCQEYSNFTKRNTPKQGKFQNCTFFFKSYFYNNKCDIESTVRKPPRLDMKNMTKSRYREVKVNLIHNNFICNNRR